jgi:hypothetical protein
MRRDCELATAMAAARRPIKAELWDDVQVHFPLVVNAYERHLASLTDNEPAGRCYSQRPAARSQDAPVRGDVAELARRGRRASRHNANAVGPTRRPSEGSRDRRSPMSWPATTGSHLLLSLTTRERG